MTTVFETRSSFDDLSARVSGQVITPTSIDYEQACLVWNLSYLHRPSVVVIPAAAEDVAVAVRHAADIDLTVTVQSTGHGIVRPADGTMLILTRELDEVAIDADTWTARIGGGAKWDRVLGPACSAGLAPLLGSTPDVGAVGYTLGGGMGWLARKYGLNADHVRWLDIVTAEGELRRVSSESDPELFWAVRGAGAGSLGVVTAMEVDLVPVTDMYAGNLLYPMGQARAVADRYRDWIATAPDELTSSLVFMNYPPLEEVPDFLRGRSFTIVRGCFLGPDDEGEALLAHWREWEPPEFDLWGPMPFSQVAMISNDPVDPMGGMSSSEWLHDLDPEAIDILIRRVFPADGPPMLIFGEIRHAGGAIGRPEEPSSYSHRDEQHLLQMVGVSDDAEGFERLERFVGDVRAELAPHTTGRVYLNFLEGAEKRERTRHGFDPATWERLVAVKQTYDPTNRFRDGLPLM